MSTRSILHSIHNWRELARKADYDATRLARLGGVSLRTLCRFFNIDLHTSLRIWLKRRRIHDGKARLRFEVLSKVIAAESGYKRPENFIRQFKLTFGASPTHWAMMRRKRNSKAENEPEILAQNDRSFP